ncbi:hypothetical protein [Hydrogenophaga intermedia]|uniref:hypothetical protein n=1 Tax=Hydrogenophaga intermedia TaxID=65786 RepID=UPI0020432A8E|nr:hypothetical protein [Hydrogenophaga intermedia]MCM3565720.1 hypothetical protein [Hydrogenophaga intermedia]
MKQLPTEYLHGLLSKPAEPDRSPSRRARPTLQRSGRETARLNEHKALRAVAQFGHLRISELARSVWPQARYAEQLARRMAARLVASGLLLERRNALGSRSLCLTRGGAAWLELRGVEAQHTLDLSSVAGSTFFHRTLATRYLVERQVEGAQVLGEYQLLRRKAPFSVDALVRVMRKLPDGMVWQRRASGPMEVELVEQEVAAKARQELEKCLRAAELVGRSLDAGGLYRVGGLVFVYDRELNHARRILLAATSLWGDRPHAERVMLERRVKLVAVELRDPLVWVGSSTVTLHDLRQRGV